MGVASAFGIWRLEFRASEAGVGVGIASLIAVFDGGRHCGTPARRRTSRGAGGPRQWAGRKAHPTTWRVGRRLNHCEGLFGCPGRSCRRVAGVINTALRTTAPHTTHWNVRAMAAHGGFRKLTHAGSCPEDVEHRGDVGGRRGAGTGLGVGTGTWTGDTPTHPSASPSASAASTDIGLAAITSLGCS